MKIEFYQWLNVLFFFLRFMLTSFLLILTKYLINLFIYSAFFWGIILCRPCLPGTVCSLRIEDIREGVRLRKVILRRLECYWDNRYSLYIHSNYL